MGKKKTRQQKKLADLRHRDTHHPALPQKAVDKKPSTFSYTPSSVIAAKKYGTLDSYAYVKHDLMKTTYFSLGIIIFQMFLLLLLRLHIIHIPNITY